MKFLHASCKTLNNSKECFETRVKCLFWLSFFLIGQFSAVHIYVELSEQFSGSQMAFGATFKVADGCRKARTSFLKRVTKRIFTISK
jgi:hypothetical protein